MAKRNGLVFATATTLYVGSFLEWRRYTKNPVSSTKHPVKGLENSLAAQWIAISLLVIVLAFTVEQAPEFGGPFALLILVAALIKYASVFGVTFNETQGK